MEVAPVQYAITDDGVSIAYQRFGIGPPLVMPPMSLMDTVTIAAEIGVPALSPHHSVVRYDRRGTGLSDREAGGFSPQEASADLDAVIRAVGDEPLPLAGMGINGPVALRYAAEHRDRVSHLVLPFSFASHSELLATPAVHALRMALDADFEFWLYATTGWSTRGVRETASLVDILREDLDADQVRRTFNEMNLHDATEVLGSIEVPTLQVIRSAYRRDTFPDQRRLASAIPGARVLIDDSDNPFALRAETQQAVAEFLGVVEPSASGVASQTIMFTDLVSSTKLTQQLGDEGAQDIVDRHDGIVRRALADYQGREIKHTGDGIMATFSSAVDAARAARTLQRELTDSKIHARVGLNSGEPVEQDGDLFGTAIQLAARVCDHANASEVLATVVVRDLTAGKDLRWIPRGDFQPKGFDESIALYALHVN